MKNFDKEIRRSSRMFNIVFWVALIMIVVSTVAQFSAIGYIGYKVATVFEAADAKDIARELGKVVKTFNSGRE